MIYSFDKKECKLYDLSSFRIIMIIAIAAISISILSGFFGFTLGERTSKKLINRTSTDKEKIVILNEADAFKRDKLIKMLKDLNLKFPHIILAQSMLETSNWNSKIFRENNNLFGMKEATKRVSTAEGSQYNHAYYKHWRESVYDYAFYQARYLSNINSENEYFQYLSATYAEDPAYVNKLRKITSDKKIRNLFE